MSALFSAFGIDWRLLVIQAINFVVLLGVLTYFLYKPVLNIIDERQRKVAEGVRTAAEATKKLQDAKSESEGMVGNAAREAEALVAAAKSRADESTAEMLRGAEGRADAIVKDAQQRAEEAKRMALVESEREIAKAAMLAAEKILSQKSA